MILLKNERIVYIKKTQNEVESLQEVVVIGFPRTYNTFGNTEL
ncbi:hypothetical protein [Spiroplasma endosymbiont of Aleiodes alternator]